MKVIDKPIRRLMVFEEPEMCTCCGTKLQKEFGDETWIVRWEATGFYFRKKGAKREFFLPKQKARAEAIKGGYVMRLEKKTEEKTS